SRLLHPIHTRRTLASQRATADEWLLWGAVPRASSELLIRRTNELTSPHHRAELARLCRRFVAERSAPRCRAYAVNRQALGTHLRLPCRARRATRGLEPTRDTTGHGAGWSHPE